MKGSFRLLQAANLLACLFGCISPSAEQIWGLEEQRSFISDSSSLPQATYGTNEMAVALPVGAQRGQFALVGSDSVDVGPGATIRRPEYQRKGIAFAAASTGVMRIGRGAEVGAVYGLSDSPVVLEADCVVDGYVKAHGSVSREPGVRVRDGIIENALGGVETFTWHVRFPVHLEPPAVSKANGPGLVLRPGAYESITIEEGSYARLQSGVYYVNSLSIETGALLEIDNSRGPLYVWIRNAFDAAGVIEEYLMDLNLLFGYLGTDPPSLGSAFRGTIVAPRATLTIPRVPDPHAGSFFARSIVLEGGASVEHHPFFGAGQVLPSPPCVQCAEAVAAKGKACCASPQLAVQRQCEAALSAAYDSCEAHYGYRPGTCSRLGFARDAHVCLPY